MSKRGYIMNKLLARAGVLALLMAASGTALADNNFGIGVKAGTLGIGIEATWRPLPYMDLRLGANAYDYDHTLSRAGIDYDASLTLKTYYATANFKFPLSPFRMTAGVYSNGNEWNLASANTGTIRIGGVDFSAAEIGTVSSTTSFSNTAPYFGFGFDFTLLNKVGLNLDFGVLWQDEPIVTMTSTGLLANVPTFLAELETERQELADEMSSFKAWPVISLGFVYNF